MARKYAFDAIQTDRRTQTMAETRSRARIRMLMSSSLTLERIMSWYSATSSGCVGTILTKASKAMYFTAGVGSQFNDMQKGSQSGSQF